MADQRCKECGQEVPKQIKVHGYHWEVKEGYNFGHWVKDKRKKITITNDGGKSGEIYKENC